MTKVKTNENSILIQLRESELHTLTGIIQFADYVVKEDKYKSFEKWHGTGATKFILTKLMNGLTVCRSNPANGECFDLTNREPVNE